MQVLQMSKIIIISLNIVQGSTLNHHYQVALYSIIVFDTGYFEEYPTWIKSLTGCGFYDMSLRSVLLLILSLMITKGLFLGLVLYWPDYIEPRGNNSAEK